MTRNLQSLIPLILWLLSVKPVAAQRPQILPSGVLDPSGKTGYVTNAEGGIDALDLSTGDVLWTSKEARRPVLVVGDQLYAQAPVKAKANALRVVVLDVTDKGKGVRESEPITFPEWVSVEERHAHSFTATWRLKKGKVILDWEARAWYGGGARPTPQMEAAARKHAAGRVVVDPESGSVESLPAQKRIDSIKPPKILEKLVVRWQGPVADRYAALVLEEDAGEQKFLLRWWNQAGEASGEPKELLRGQRLLVLATADSRYLCLREAAERPDERLTPEDRSKRSWFVFDPEAGERVGTAPYEAGTQALVVVPPRAYFLVTGPLKGPLTETFVQPRVLKAADLQSGKVLWERPVEGKRHVPPPP
jgi:hypothetical protein